METQFVVKKKTEVIMQKVFPLSIISFIISVIMILTTKSSSIALMLTLFLLIITIFCFIISKKNKKDTINLLIILYSSFIFYILYAYIAYSGYMENNSFFMYPNEDLFYQACEYLGGGRNIIDIYTLCFIDRIHIDGEGFYFLIGVIAYVANTFFDGNSVFLQIINISFAAIMINIFIYLFLQNNGVSKNILKYTLIYAFLSPIFYFSPWILRDIHITLFYSIGLVLATSRFSITKLILFIPLILVTIEFRLEHGLFLLALVFYYVIFKGRYHPHYKVIYFFLIFLTIFTLGYSISFLGRIFPTIMESFNRYMEYTSERVEERQGLSKYLYTLPYGIKHLTIGLYSQFTQFPPWASLDKHSTFAQTLIGVVALIKSIFWSLLFLVSLFSFFYKKIRKDISPEIFTLFLIYSIFILLNVSNINERRLLGVYPILFLYACILKQKTNKKYFTDILRKSVILYLIMISLYILLS